MVKYSVLPLVFLIVMVESQKIDPTELKCLVCKQTLTEVQKLVEKIDPDVEVDAGGYRLDGEGNLKRKTVSLANSEVYLSDMLEKVCEKMDDYVRARDKSTGELKLIKLIDENGKMSVDMMTMGLIQDSDLNKSLKYYCEMLIEEHEEPIIENLIKNNEDIEGVVCSESAGYCGKAKLQEEL